MGRAGYGVTGGREILSGARRRVAGSQQRNRTDQQREDQHEGDWFAHDVYAFQWFRFNNSLAPAK